jgi:hypothetical protein
MLSIENQRRPGSRVAEPLVTLGHLLLTAGCAGGRLLGASFLAVAAVAIFQVVTFPDAFDERVVAIPGGEGPIDLVVSPGEVVRLEFPDQQTPVTRAAIVASFNDAGTTTTIPVAWWWDWTEVHGLLVVPYFEANVAGTMDGTLSGTFESDAGQASSFERPLRVSTVGDGEDDRTLGPPDPGLGDSQYLETWAPGLMLLDVLLFAVLTAHIYHQWTNHRSANTAD